MVNRRGDLGCGNHRRGGDKNVVAAIAVNTALHGIDQNSPFGRGLGYASAEIGFNWERSFRGFIGHKFNRPEQANSPDIADGIQATQLFEVLLQRGSDAASTV